MKTPKVLNGVWYRNIHYPWSHENTWRTDIPASVLYRYPVETAAFLLDSGLRVFVPILELRRVLQYAPTRQKGGLIGPFSVSPLFSEINDEAVAMRVETPDDGPDILIYYDRN